MPHEKTQEEKDNKNQNTFHPALYLLKKETNENNVITLTNAVIEDISTSENKKDMDKRIGTGFMLRNLERELSRRFLIFKELSRLSLFKIGIEPVRTNDSILLSVTISFPPKTENISTPNEDIVATVIQGWIIDNNLHKVCPITIINSKTFFMSL